MADTEPQNLIYMNYIAITNQLLILHDIIHDFNPISHKVRLSKSTNLIKQTIAHVTTIPYASMPGGMPGRMRPKLPRGSRRMAREIEYNEIHQIRTFFISNLLPPSLLLSLRELKNGEYPAVNLQDFLRRCFAYKQYIMNPPRNRSNIMARNPTQQKRLFFCTINDDIYFDLETSIRRAYTNNFMEIFNTYMNTSLPFLRRSERIRSQRPEWTLVGLYSIITNIRNNWSVDNYIMNGVMQRGIEGSLQSNTLLPRVLSSDLSSRISQILISFTENYDMISAKIIGIFGYNPFNEEEEAEESLETPLRSTFDYIQGRMRGGAKIQRGGTLTSQQQQELNNVADSYAKSKPIKQAEANLAAIKAEEDRLNTQVKNEREDRSSESGSSATDSPVSSQGETPGIEDDEFSLGADIDNPQLNEMAVVAAAAAEKGRNVPPRPPEEKVQLPRTPQRQVAASSQNAPTPGQPGLKRKSETSAENDSDPEWWYGDEWGDEEKAEWIKFIQQIKQRFEVLEKRRKEELDAAEEAVMAKMEWENARMQQDQLDYLREQTIIRLTEWRRKLDIPSLPIQLKLAQASRTVEEGPQVTEVEDFNPCQSNTDCAENKYCNDFGECIPKTLSSSLMAEIRETKTKFSPATPHQIFPNIELSSIQERELTYNGFINSFDILLSTYSKIEDTDDLILLNFAYIMKTSFIVYKELHKDENILNILSQEEYKNMVFTGFLLIVSNIMFDEDYFLRKSANNPLLVTENFIDIITNNSEEEQEVAEQGGGSLIIQKGGANLSLSEEYYFLTQKADLSSPEDFLEQLQNYDGWIEGSIRELTAFKDYLITNYNHYKPLLNDARYVKSSVQHALRFYRSVVGRSSISQLKNWIVNTGRSSVIKVGNLQLGIPSNFTTSTEDIIEEMRIGSSLFNITAFQHLQNFTRGYTPGSNGVDLDLFVKFPIRWIFLSSTEVGHALRAYQNFYTKVDNYDRGNHLDDGLVQQWYEYIDVPQPRPFKVRATRITNRLLYEPVNDFIAQIKGIFTTSSSSTPPSYLGYRIDQRIKNLEKKKGKIQREIGKATRERERERKESDRRAARATRERKTAEREAGRAARNAAAGIITGKTQGFADYLTIYIARMGLHKINTTFIRYFVNGATSNTQWTQVGLNFSDNQKYWTRIISRLCINYDDWVANVEITKKKYENEKKNPSDVLLNIKKDYPLGNQQATSMVDFINIDITLQLVRKICGLELFCIAQAAKYINSRQAIFFQHLSHTTTRTLQDVVPGQGILDERLRTGIEDILTNVKRGGSGTVSNLFNNDQFNHKKFVSDGVPFSLKDIEDNILIYGGTTAPTYWKNGDLKRNSIRDNLNLKFHTSQNPVNTRYIINNSADSKNLRIPYKTRPNRPDKVYPNSRREKEDVNTNANINNICTTSSIVDKQPQCTYNVAVTNNNRLSLNTRFQLLPADTAQNISYIGEVINKHQIGGVEQNGMVVAYNIDLLWSDFNIHINKVVNIETGADLKAPLVYETVLDAIRDYHTENGLLPASNIPRFWLNKMGDDDFFNRILTKILVKSQGDMIQEINATFRYGAMENMKDWQKETNASTDEDKDRYKMVTAKPSLVSSELSSDPFRIGLSNDQPAGVRKVLYNLYSILNLTGNADTNRITYMNENNVSGYFGGTNTLMIRGKYKNPSLINIGAGPGDKPQTAFVGGKSKKKTKRKKRKKKKTRRKNKRRKKTKRRRRKRKKTRRRR